MPTYNPNLELQNVVYVNSMDDLMPYLVGDEFILDDWKVYEFAPNIFTFGAYKIVCPAMCVLKGQGTFITVIASELTAGDFITATETGGSLHIEGIQFTFSDPGCSVFNVDGLEQLLVTSSFFIGECTIGTLANVQTIRFGTLCSLVGFSAGLALDGNFGTVIIDRAGLINIGSSPAPKFIYTLPTTVIGLWLSIAGCKCIIPSGTIAFDIDFATTFSLGYHKFEIFACSFDFGGTALSGITPNNSNAFARANFGVRDSKAYASCYVDTPSATNFVSAGVAVKANGQTTSLGERDFTQNDNQITYDVPTPIQLHITANAFITPANPATTAVTLYIAKNGTVITPGTRVPITTAGVFVSNTKVVDAVATDYFEIWVANESDTNQVTLEDNGTELIAVAL